MNNKMKVGLFIMMLAVFLLVSGCKDNKGDGIVTPTPSANGAGTGGTTPTPSGNAGTGSNDSADAAPIEGNNIKADLQVTDIYWSTIHPEPGQEVELTVKVFNPGVAPVASFDYAIDIKKDGIAWKNEVLTAEAGVDAGNTTKLKKTYTLPQGEYTAAVYLDKGNAIKELNEFNNVMETKAAAKSAIIVQPTPSPSNESDDEE